MSEHPTRRRLLVSIVAGGVTIIVIVAVTAALIAAQAASQAVDDINANQKTSDTRSAAAKADRTSLLSQVDQLRKANRKLSRQVAALTAYLKSQGIDVPSALRGQVTASSGKASAPTRPKPKKPGATTPAPAAPAAPAPVTPAPQPAPTPAPLACILGICLG